MKYVKADVGNIVVNVCQTKRCSCKSQLVGYGVIIPLDPYDGLTYRDCFRIYSATSGEKRLIHKVYFKRVSSNVLSFDFACNGF